MNPYLGLSHIKLESVLKIINYKFSCCVDTDDYRRNSDGGIFENSFFEKHFEENLLNIKYLQTTLIAFIVNSPNQKRCS